MAVGLKYNITTHYSTCALKGPSPSKRRGEFSMKCRASVKSPDACAVMGHVRGNA